MGRSSTTIWLVMSPWNNGYRYWNLAWEWTATSVWQNLPVSRDTRTQAEPVTESCGTRRDTCLTLVSSKTNSHRCWRLPPHRGPLTQPNLWEEAHTALCYFYTSNSRWGKTILCTPPWMIANPCSQGMRSYSKEGQQQFNRECWIFLALIIAQPHLTSCYSAVSYSQ